MSDITFSFSRTTSFNISCKAGLLATNSLNFCLSKKNFPLHFSRIISQGTEFWIGDFFCLFHQFKYFILFPSCLCGCWEAAEHNSHLYSSGVWYFFPLASFNIFSLYFITGTWANKLLGMCGEVGEGVGIGVNRRSLHAYVSIAQSERRGWLSEHSSTLSFH